MSTITLWVPSKFWNDHADRCPSDEDGPGLCNELRHAGNRTLVEGDAAQVECLRSDAAFYAGDNVDDCKAMQRSARATLEAIRRANSGT